MKSLNKTRFYVEPVKKADVASVAVVHDDKILMMQRRDNSRWTLPGGHLDEGEKPSDGAKRELKEEAGIIANKVRSLGSEKLTSFTGKKMTIHAFIYEPKQKPTFNSKNDPDQEAGVHKWVSIKDFPQDIKDNLHSPRNTVLKKIGILKSLMDAGIDLLMKGVKGQSAANHKYIRKYKRGSKWVYVYIEPTGKSRTLPPEWIKAVEAQAELGDELAIKMLEDVVEYSQGKIEELRKLNAIGDELAKRHLKTMGIDPDVEDVVDSMKPTDPVNAPLNASDKNKVFSALDAALKDRLFDRLNSYRTNPIGVALTRLVGSDWGVARTKIMSAINKKNTIEEMLQEFHRQLNVIDAALPASANGTVNQAGGTGNYVYAAAIEGMTANRILPTGYKAIHSRTRGSAEHVVQPLAEIRERAAAAEAAAAKAKAAEEVRTRAQNEELFAKHGTSVTKMASYFNKTLSMSDQVNLAKGINKFFGGDFNFDKFVKSLQGHQDVEIKVGSGFFSGLLTGETSFSVYFSFINRQTGAPLKDYDSESSDATASRTLTKNSDGSITWRNGCFPRFKPDDQDRFPKIANGLYAGVESFLREVTKNYTGSAKENTRIIIGQAANSGFGGRYKGALVWAKHCFDFSDPSEASSWKMLWKLQIDRRYSAAGMSREDVDWVKRKIDGCNYPDDFVRLGLRVTKDQALKITGRTALDADFERVLREKGSIDVGELILVDIRKSFDQAQNYINKSTGRAGELNNRRKVAYKQAVATATPEVRMLTPLVSTPVSTPQPSASSSSTGSTSPPAHRLGHSAGPGRIHDQWDRERVRRDGSAIIINKPKMDIILRWPKEDVKIFANNAKIAPSARRKIKVAWNMAHPTDTMR